VFSIRSPGQSVDGTTDGRSLRRGYGRGKGSQREAGEFRRRPLKRSVFVSVKDRQFRQTLNLVPQKVLKAKGGQRKNPRREGD